MPTKTETHRTIQQRLSNLAPKVGGVALLIATILIPLLILPFGENFLLDSKNLLFFVSGLIIFAIWTVNAFAKKTIQVTLSSFVLPVVLLLVSTLLSSFLNGTYPVNHLVGFGGIYITFSLIVLLAPSLIPERFGRYFLFLLPLPAILLSLTSLAELLHVGPSLVFNSLFQLGLPNSPLFSLAGSPLLAIQIMIVSLVGCLVMLFSVKKIVKPFFFLSCLVIAGGIIITGRTLLQQKILTDVLPPFAASWSIGADNLKSIKSTFIGVGPEYYQQNYLHYKPAWLNTTPVWNLQFNQASNLPLTLIVTHGFLGVIAWFMLLIAIMNRSRNNSSATRPFVAMVLTTILIELLLPPNIVLLAFQAFLLVFWVVSEKNKLKDVQVHAFTVQLIKSGTDIQKVPKHSNFLVYFLTGLSALSIVLCAYWLSVFGYAQYEMFQAISGTVHNNAQLVYTAQQKAISLDPYSASYLRAFANTNLAIAQSLAQNKNMTEQDKQQILNLIQQAIQIAKNTITIEPENSLNWVIIARTYNNLVGVADGADNLALSSYNQAISFSPTDPVINLELGGLYYRLGQYPQAVQQLEKTVQLKPDWANAYYNLANAYRQNKQFQQAYDAYQQTLVLLPSGDDYSKVKLEQDDVKKALDAATQAAAQQTQAKQAVLAPTPTPRPTPQTVELAPSPSPTEVPSPTPAPSPTEEVNPSAQPTP